MYTSNVTLLQFILRLYFSAHASPIMYIVKCLLDSLLSFTTCRLKANQLARKYTVTAHCCNDCVRHKTVKHASRVVLRIFGRPMFKQQKQGATCYALSQRPAVLAPIEDFTYIVVNVPLWSFFTKRDIGIESQIYRQMHNSLRPIKFKKNSGGNTPEFRRLGSGSEGMEME